MLNESEIQNNQTQNTSAPMDAPSNDNPNNSYYSSQPNHMGNTRPNCPQQNPYYQNPQNHPGMGMGGNNPYISQTSVPQTGTPVQNGNGFNTGDFVKGALIGAAATYLMTNKNVQDALFKTVAKTSSLFQMGMEEVKERFEDAKAEVQAQNQVDQ